MVIITDGEVTDPDETASAIIEASNYPLSIIAIGVGDGPFDTMETFDDYLTERKFDNFQFVNYAKVLKKARNKNINFEIQFAIDALQEIPKGRTRRLSVCRFTIKAKWTMGTGHHTLDDAENALGKSGLRL